MGIKKYKNDLIIISSFILILSIFVKCFYEPFRIPTSSMEPGIAKGDFIVVNKFKYRATLPFIKYKGDSIQREDIVVFKNNKDKNNEYVKRVIAIPGDEIEIKDKKIIINGEIQKQIDYKNIDSDYSIRLENRKKILLMNKNYKFSNYKKTKLLTDQYFVMGDNRDNSYDSRFFGSINRDSIKGKVETVWFTINYNSKYLSTMERLFIKL